MAGGRGSPIGATTGLRVFGRPPADADALRRSSLRRRAVRDGAVIAGWMVGVWILVVVPAVGNSLGYDAYSYWFGDLPARYALAEASPYALGAFRYGPPLGLAFSVFSTLPWWLFLWLWMALLVGVAVWLAGPRVAVVAALPPVALELYHGNVHLLMAAAIVLGFRHPWTWSFVLLAKVTPGVALLWFAVRREWRSLGVALGATAGVALLSFLVAPDLWEMWLQTLLVGAGGTAALSIPPPLPVRLVIAAGLVVWGARTDRPWTVGVAAMLSLPHLWPHGTVLALAALPFIGRPRLAHWSFRRLAVAVSVAVAVASAAVVLGGETLQRALLWASSAIMLWHGGAS